MEIKNLGEKNKFKIEVSTAPALRTPPTLFTPNLDINLGSGVLTITDGNGSFATYVIEVKGENSSYTLETKSKSILLENEGITHNEKQTISVKAKGEKFFDSETASVFWDYIDYTPNLAYTLNADGNGYTCSGMGTATIFDGKLVIPSEYEGLPVTDIKNYAFYKVTGINEIIIKDGVKKIGEGSFFDMGISKIVLPPSITTIVSNGVRNAKLTELNFAEGLQVISTWAFDNSIKFEKIVFPKSLTQLDYEAFASNPSLKEVIFKGKPSILGNAFNRCANLTSIKVPFTEGEVAGAPWGAVNATITYNYTGD